MPIPGQGTALKKLGNKNMQDHCYYGSVTLTAHGAQDVTVSLPYARIWGSKDGRWTGEIKLSGPLPDELRDVCGGTVTVKTTDAVHGTATATLDLVDSTWTVHLKGLRTYA